MSFEADRLWNLQVGSFHYPISKNKTFEETPFRLSLPPNSSNEEIKKFEEEWKLKLDNHNKRIAKSLNIDPNKIKGEIEDIPSKLYKKLREKLTHHEKLRVAPKGSPSTQDTIIFKKQNYSRSFHTSCTNLNRIF